MSGRVYHQSYVHGLDGRVPLTSLLVESSLPPTQMIKHMTLYFASYYDSTNETLEVLQYSHPSLSVAYKNPPLNPDSPQVLYVTGDSPLSVYLQFLRHVYYSNRKGVPTIGHRLILVKLYSDSSRSNSLVDSYVNMSVGIHNEPPVVAANGNEESYTNRYYPNNEPVPALSPTAASVRDTDSQYIHNATVTIMNPLDESHESLQVTYRSPERQNRPIIVEGLGLSIPFGLLFSGQRVPEISHTLSVASTGLVSDVSVIVDIKHSWVGDLKLELVHGHRTVLLVLSPGGPSCPRDDLHTTTFDTESSGDLFLSKSSVSPGLCQFQTRGYFSSDESLKGFSGDPIEGNWTLRITDLLTGRDNGQLDGWGLVIRPEETHLIVSSPPVSPVITVRGREERTHYRDVAADGRITDLSISLHLASPFTSALSYLPTLKLVHPDGTVITLSTQDYPLCAYGNFSYIIFDDRASSDSDYTDYSCLSLYGTNESSSGELSSSASGYNFSSGSGSEFSQYLPTLDDIIDLNISIPLKRSLVDSLAPRSPLSLLCGKQLSGRWTLVVSSEQEASLVGWTLHIAREPNIDHQYNPVTGVLSLIGLDSPANYQSVLSSVVYNNNKKWPNFSEERRLVTQLHDGQAHSNTTLAQSHSYITVHHIIIDLDPRNITAASAPNYYTKFQEHSPSIPLLDASNAILTDGGFSEGLYSLLIAVRNYSNFNMEGVLFNESLVEIEQLQNKQYATINDNDDDVLTLNISTPVPRAIEVFERVLRTVEYYNNAEELFGISRSIEFKVYDLANGNQFISTVAIATVDFVFTNDPPVLVLNPVSPGAPYIVYYDEGEGEALLTNDSLISLTDNDDEYLQSITISITNPYDTVNEYLDIDEYIIDTTSIRYYYNLSSNTLLLYGEDTLDNYTAVLGSITYNNTVHSPGNPDPTTRVVSFVPFDGTKDGRPAFTLISFMSINDAPFGDLNGFKVPGIDNNVTFVEERGPVPLLDSDSFIMDVDNVTLSYISVRVINPMDGPDEILAVRNVSERSPDSTRDVVITLNYLPEVVLDSESSLLTISGLKTVYEYQEVLKTLSYNNIADEPDQTDRTIEIILNDGLLDSDPLYVGIRMELINDSPYFNDTVSPFRPHINEDVSIDDNTGINLFDLSYLILDDDIDSVPGIAIISIDSSNGQWQYSLYPQTTRWSDIRTPLSVSNALTLSAGAATSSRLRFLPNRDYNGVASFTVVAWDGTDGPIGSYTNALSHSFIDSYSYANMQINLTVVPVNDAPVLYEVLLNFTSIDEDDYNSTGDTVLSLLQFAYDVDIPLQQNELGLAITAADRDNGLWQYSHDSGASWTEFGSVSVEYALLLRSLPEESQRVRFVPNKDYNGLVSISFKAWDLSYDGLINANDTNDDLILGSGSGLMSGSDLLIPESNNTNQLPLYVNTSLSDPVIGPISVNTTSATIFVEPINDSPVIREGMAMMLIKEDIAIERNHGTKVANIITYSDQYYNDVDAYSERGLAVVHVNNQYGVWQYTCDSPSNSSSWRNFIGDVYYGLIVPPLPLEEKATLLAATCSIRFLPQTHFNTELDYVNNPRPLSDTPYIIVHGWDNTGLTQGLSGTYGNDATYANSSITNEYSSDSVIVRISIQSVNDVPILFLTNETKPSFLTVFYEDLPSIPAVGEDLTLIDNDHDRLVSATITIYGGFEESPYNQTEVNEFIELRRQSLEGNTDDMVLGSGSGGNASNTSLPSDPVQLQYIEYLQLYVLNKSNPTPEELYCAGLSERKEELFITTLYTDLVTEITSWCPFTITIYTNPDYSLPDTDKTQFQKVLRTVRYNNSIQEPLGDYRTISFVVSDGVGDSVTVNTTIFIEHINDAPILDINDYIPDVNNYVVYTEGDVPVILANYSGLRLVDFDNVYLQSATITLLIAPDTVNETLSADVTGTNINMTYINYTLYLTGNDTVESYAEVLATVTYTNTYAYPGHPDETMREIEFVVSDGNRSSSPALCFVTFIGVNDRPNIDVNGDAFGHNYTAQFREEEGPVSVTSPFTILTDVDNVTLEYVTARILNPLDGRLESLDVDSIVLERVIEKKYDSFEKVVEVTNLVPNVTYNSTSATLHISGLDSVYEYKLILRTITYNNLADEFMRPSRIIEFIASDGVLESFPAYTRVDMIPINDSPFFNSVPIIVPHIREDETNSEGESVSAIASPLIEDDDSLYEPITKGIAVVNTEDTNGAWQYKLNGSSVWNDLPANTSYTRAVLLTATNENFIRFVPNKDFNGNSSLTFVAWDTVDELPDGHVRVALTNDSTDPFSAESRSLLVVVMPVNDAPVLNTSVTIVLPPILEDDVIDRPSLGVDVSIFLPSLLDDVDQPIDSHEFGIAVVGADQSNGYWQFSTDQGTSWSNMSSPSPTSALVLRTEPYGTHRVRFAPRLNYNGDTSLQFKLWDMNDTYPSGQQGVNTETTDSVTGTFSRDTGTATLDIEPVNDSPTLDSGPVFPDIEEDYSNFNNLGTYVSVITNFVYNDVDGTDDIGVAVVGVDRRYGEWQYTCDGLIGTRWLPFIGGYQFGQIAPRNPIPERATLLLDTCRIRFVPQLDFNSQFDENGDPRPSSDTPYIEIKGWDNTGSTNGFNLRYGIDTTSGDHTDSFSKEIEHVNITVTSINDRPVLNLNGTQRDYQTIFTETWPKGTVVPVQVVDPLTFNLTDVDNNRLVKAVIYFTWYDGFHESLIINVTGTGLNYTVTYEGSLYVLTLEPLSGDSAPIEDFQSSIKTLQYQNTAEEPDPTSRVVTFRVDDFDSFSSTSRSTVLIELVNDPPDIDLNVFLNDTYNLVNYTEGQGPVLLLDEDDLSLTDNDNTSFYSISVVLNVNPDGQYESLSANNSDTNLTISYSNSTLLIQGPGSVSDFVSVLLTVSYNNSLSHPGSPSDDTRVIDFIVNDGLNVSSAPVYLSFTAVNNRPILDLNGNDTGFDFRTRFYEEEGPVAAVDQDMILIDIDNDTLEYIMVVISNPLDGFHERLWVRNVTEYIGNPFGLHYSVWNFRPKQYYNYTNSTLFITGLESVYEYQQVLKTLRYNNSADEPQNETRVLSFFVSDGLSIRSGVRTNIDIININDSPYINQSVIPYHPITYEDISNDSNIGWSLETITTDLILDDDANHEEGVAIVALDSLYGHWEYTTNYKKNESESGSGGIIDLIIPYISGSGEISGSGSVSLQTIWHPLPVNTSLSYATVLRVNGDTNRLRFVPHKDFNGNVSFSFVAWDTTDHLSDGSITNATSVSRTDPFSDETVTITATVSPVNDAPLLSNDTVSLMSILEDDVNSVGNDVGLLTSGITDIDTSDLIHGVSIIETDSDNGTWQYTTDGGNTWNSLPSAVSLTNSLLISSDPPGMNRIRFLPHQDFNGNVSITFLAWDLTSGEASGTEGVDVSISDPITGPVSTSSTEAVLYIEPVNDSPVIREGMSLSTIIEDYPVSDNEGDTVAYIANSLYYTDVDDSSQTGLAVVGVDVRNGVWQYKCKGNWSTFIGNYIYGIVVPLHPRPEKATLLSSDCRIRFLPNYLFNSVQYLDGMPRPPSETPYIIVRGWDNTGLSQGLSGRYGIDTTYNNDSILNEFSSETEKVTITVSSVNNLPVLKITSEGDGESYSVLFTEDDPYVRIVDPESVSITDLDHINLKSITVIIENVYDDEDEILSLIIPSNVSDIDYNDTLGIVSVSNGNETEILRVTRDSSFNDSSFNDSFLLLESEYPDLKVSLESYAKVLKYIVYINTHTEPVNETRLIRFHVNDSEGTNSNVTTSVEYRLLAENHPILRTYLYQISFTEGEASPIPLVSSNLSLTDLDHNEFFYIASVKMELSPVPISNKEYLSVTISPSDGLTQYYNPLNGIFLITGSAPVHIYQSVLRTAVYHNIIDEPPSGQRTVTIQVTDAHRLHSNTETVTINVSVINDRTPVIKTLEDPFEYLEHLMETNPVPLLLSNGLLVSDADSGDLPLHSITIELTNPLNEAMEEILSVQPATGIRASYINYTLSLTGPASVSHFQETLSTLTYVNLAEEPVMEERVIELIAYDGIHYSNVSIISIDILLLNDAPVIDLNGPNGIDVNYMIEYTEGSGPVSIVNESDLIIYDNDNDYLTSLVVVIENPFDAPNEVLAVSIPNNYTIIRTSYNTSSGVLTLSGNATVSEYEEIIRTITYSNNEALPGHPNTTMRRIRFNVFDANNSSRPAVTFLTFSSVNDPPMIDLNGDAPGVNYSVVFIEEGSPVYLTDRNVTLVDVDSSIISEVKVVILNCLDGDLEDLSLDDDSKLPPLLSAMMSQACEFIISGSGTAEEFQSTLRLLTYSNNADEPQYSPRLIEITADDGFNKSIPVYTSVTILPVNDPPTLQIASGSFTYGVNVGVSDGRAPNVPDPVSGFGSGFSSSGSGDIDSSSSNASTLGSGDDTMMTQVNVTEADFLTLYTENGPSVLIVQPQYVLVRDEDNNNLQRLQVTLQNELDIGQEAIFFDEEELNKIPDESLRRALKIVLGGYVQNGCPIGRVHYPMIDLELLLTLEQMNYTVKSLHYCNTDEDPSPDNRTITFRVQDPQGAWSNIETAIVQIRPINDAPLYRPSLGFDPTISTLEDTPITIGVLQNFFDNEETLTGSAIRVVRIEPGFGVATVNKTDGSINYSPAINDNGIRVIHYQACDSRGTCSIVQNITVTITPVNDPPYLSQDLIIEIEEDIESIVINLTQYLADHEDDLVPSSSYPVATGISDITLLTVFLDSTNKNMMTIEPTLNSNGVDVFKLTFCDSQGSCTTVNVTVIILPVNDLPEIIVNYPPSTVTYTTDEDVPLSLSVTLYDVESNLSTPMIVSFPYMGNGMVTLSPPDRLTTVPVSDAVVRRRNSLRQEVDFTYTPDPDYNGNDYITLSALDSEGGVSEVNISIIVQYINDAPRFGITSLVIEEDTPHSLTLPGGLGVSDPEETLNPGSFYIIQQPQHGVLSYDPINGTLLYVPDLHYFSTPEAPEYYIIGACDGAAADELCTNVTINVTVLSTNDAPVLPPFTVTVYEDHVLTFNLSNHTFDVEDQTPPISLITLLDPLPSHGIVQFNRLTGIITYTPNKDYYGMDYIYFESCDTDAHCTNGTVTIIVLNVNDPPTAESFTYDVIEDDFDLISIRDHSDDSESPDTDLKISLVDPNTNQRLPGREGTTLNGASLRIYQSYGIITYEPSSNFIGYDNFTFMVCDTCDPSRLAELGKISIDEDCVRQNEVRGSTTESATCAVATVSLVVANDRDVPVIKNIVSTTVQGLSIVLNPFTDSRVLTTNGYFYSNSSLSVYDVDDYQSVYAMSQGFNLTQLQLASTTNINESSLRLTSQPNGAVEILTRDNISYFRYTPQTTFSGYDSFTYEICDISTDERLPLCSQATANIRVTRAGPSITSVMAVSSVDSNGNDTDSKVSRGDSIRVSFSVDTNMPPYNSTTDILSTSDIEQLFEFPQGFIPSHLISNPYQGRWITPSQLEINITDEGYPQPESKIGQWTIAVRNNPGQICGAVDENGQVTYTRYCLLSSDRFSTHSTSVSPPLSGDWGLRLPELTAVLLRNVGVDDETQMGDDLFFLNSQIKILLKEPLSHLQLQLYCRMPTEHILNGTELAENMTFVVVGCENKIKNGSNTEDTYPILIQDTLRYFSSFSSDEGTRRKRQTSSQRSDVEQPVISEITLRVVRYSGELKINPVNNPVAFTSAITRGFNRTTLAVVIQELLGVDAEILERIDRDTGRTSIGAYYTLHDNIITPYISSVTANDPNCLHTEAGTGDTLTIAFSDDTNQPAVATKSDIDKIFRFDPPLASDYTGNWETPSSLVITIGNGPSQNLSLTSFSLTFTPNTFHDGSYVVSDNTYYPTLYPQCIGINVCTNNGSHETVGVCSANGLSCRAYAPHQNLAGDFSGGAICLEPDTTPLTWLWVLIGAIGLILIFLLVLLICYCYRRYKQKKQREEAMRVVKRWEKEKYDVKKETEKKDKPAPWVKPPDVQTIRDNADPFSDTAQDPFRNMPRPPTAANENLPPIAAIPKSFIPRAGGRVAPMIPSMHGIGLSTPAATGESVSSLHSLSPLVSTFNDMHSHSISIQVLMITST